MRKKLAIVLAALMAASLLLTACNTGTQNSGNSDSSATSSTAAGGSDSSAAEEEVNQEPVTITMVGEGELVTTLMGEKLKEYFPYITVEFYHPDGTGWVSNEMLITWAAAGTLPDIVTLQNPELIYSNDLVVNLKPYFDADPDNGNFYQDIIKYSMINDTMMMLPYQMSFYGVMVNTELIASNNLEVPGYDWTMEEFENIVKTLTVPGSMLGTYDANLWQFMVPQFDETLELAGYNRETNTWDLGEGWQQSLQLMADLAQGNYTAKERLDAVGQDADGSWDSYYALSREIINDDDPWYAWQKGTVATWAEASYWSQWDLNNEMYPGFEWDFYPIPVAEEGAVSRPCLIPDNYAITKSCQNVEAAYEVLKFFTYSKDGFNARYDIWKNYDPAALKEKYPEMAEVEGTIPDTMSFNLSPVDDQEVRDKWAELYNPKPGLKYIIDNMSTSKPYADGFKVIPGWEEVMTNTVLPAVTEQVISGEKTAAELAATLEEQVNAMQAEVMASMEQATS